MRGEHAESLLHLSRDYTEPIRDPLWKNIFLSPALKELISLPPFQKLGRIKQLGPAFHVYPGAVHTRLNHSIGVFHLARLLLLSLIEKSDASYVHAHTSRSGKNRPSGIGGALHETPGALSSVNVEGVKSFLTAALFHDLGHFPFAHSLKELPLRSHEALGAEGITSPPLSTAIEQKLGCSPERIAAIIDEDRDAEGDEEVIYFRRLLSGVLDPDKLDYLNRDAYFCGIHYGIQDTEYVFHKLSPHGEYGVALESDGLTAVENILFSKYLMYRTVYWHKVVRIATAMIKHPLNMAMVEGILSPQSLYWLDDEEFFSRFSEETYRPYSLIGRVLSRDLYKTAVEQPYEEERHGRLLSLEQRLNESERIAGVLSKRFHRTVSPWEVIIDIPEPISFEIELPILKEAETVPFSHSESVFSPPVVEGFTSSLRRLRIFLPPEVAESIEHGEELLS